MLLAMMAQNNNQQGGESEMVYDEEEQHFKTNERMVKSIPLNACLSSVNFYWTLWIMLDGKRHLNLCKKVVVVVVDTILPI